jgi:hypothetical protein
VKRLLLCLVLAGLCLFSADSKSSASPHGSVGAQAIGRIVFDNDGNGQVICYFTVFGPLRNLFSGPPSEATAHFTGRSTKFKVNTTLNGAAVHFQTVPVEGDAILVNFYYDLSPDQDFTRPDTFSNGELFSTWRWHSSLGTINPLGITPSIGGVDLVSSKVIFPAGVPFNITDSAKSGTAFFNISGAAIAPHSSLPFSAAFVISN